MKTYSAVGGTLELKDVCRTSDGGYVITGFKGPLYNPIIIKLNNKAEVEWNKIYGNLSWANKVLQTEDGNFIVATFSPYRSQITKLSNNGNLLWSKEFTNLNGYNLHLYDIQEINDGGFVMIFNSAYGLGYMYNYIVRIDSTANVIWKKEILHDVHEPMVKSLLVVGNSIFIAADFYNGSSKKRIDIAKLDLQSGDFVWKRRLEANLPNLFDPHLAMINDTLCVSSVANWNTPTSAIRRFSLVTLNANSGDKISSFEFTNPVLAFNVTYYSIYDIGPFHFNKTNDNNLFFAQLVNHNNDTVINVTKFTSTGNVIWSKNYINYTKHDVWSAKSDNDELLIAGRRYVNYPNTTDVGFLMRLNRDGNLSEQTLLPTQDCFNESAAVNTQPFAITEMVSSNFLSTSTFNQITDSTYIPQFDSATIIANESCHSIDSTCSTFSVSGPSSVCLDSSFITYTAVKNQGCSNQVNWVYDSAFVRVHQITDSSITIKFLKSGYTVITSRLSNSCSIFTVNNPVQVYRKANSLNLGPNRTVCFPQSFILNTQGGFFSYLWNNNSTDSTLNVTRPGTYFVDVVDYCGNLFSDTISVINAPAVEIDLGGDRQKCNDDTLHLNAPSGFVNYSWGPNYNIINSQPDQVIVYPVIDTEYYVRVEAANGCFGYDTVRVHVNISPKIQLGADKSICIKDSLLLNAGVGFTNYQWSINGASQQIYVHTTGQYTVIGTTLEGCKSYDTIKVLNNWPKPLVSLDKKPELCYGTTRNIDAGNFTSYLWNTGETTKTIIVDSIGSYSVKVLDINGCSGSDSTKITAIIPSPTSFLPKDTALCLYGNLLIKPTSAFNNYLWSTGSNSSQINVTQAGLYWLQVTDSKGCLGKDSILVLPKECLNGFFMPAAFTPNNDGINDFLKPILLGNVKQYKFWIYNRWGQLVFYSSELFKGWNGNYKLQKQEGSTFVWVCIYQFNGEPVENKKGTFILIR
ncbi:MAG: gliding motility-associated C-terminal domain-containing protein [Ferruginibacter sp.]